MNECITCFITWTTYGTWLPGDGRGWRKKRESHQPPQPLLEAWCRDRLSERTQALLEIAVAFGRSRHSPRHGIGISVLDTLI